MLRLCAAQLKDQIANGTTPQKPIWIDLGGGTGKTYIPFCSYGSKKGSALHAHIYNSVVLSSFLCGLLAYVFVFFF